jgi:hydroxymethylpyrimidine pyrophosphatase-like HAD family hydrolase
VPRGGPRGTLTDSEGVIHHEVVEALERLRRRGVKVVIATGASYPAAITLAYYLRAHLFFKSLKF